MLRGENQMFLLHGGSMTESVYKRISWWLALWVAVGVTLFHNWYFCSEPWLPDDVFITLRYAENFANGNGIVYNLGERVEGYTCFLWVVLLGVGDRLGFDLTALPRALCLVFGLATLLLVAFAHRFVRGLERSTSALAVVMLGTCGVFTRWTFGGMEVPLVAFLIVLALLVNERAKQSARPQMLTVLTAVCCVLAAMSRPDAGLVFAVLFADRLVAGIREKNWGFMTFGAVFALLYGAYFLWRFNYYGYLLPNTFYAKIGGTWEQFSKGMNYAANFSGATFFILAPIVIALLMRKGAFGNRGFRHVLLALLGLHTAYVILVGGDFMACFRFFATALPVFCLLGAMGTMACRPKPVAAVLFALIVICHNSLMMADHKRVGRPIGNGNVARNGERVGRWLKEHADPSALLATNTAGSVAFFSGLHTIDTLGLCDETIAHRNVPMGMRGVGHEKGDGAYVLSRKPDYVQFGSASGSEKPVFRGDSEISNFPEFKRDYILRQYRIAGGHSLRLYVRKREAGGKGLNAKALK